MERLRNSIRTALLVSVALLVLGPVGCSDDEEDTCQEGEYQCVGQELQKCDADGVFQMEEMCGANGSMCMASMGHCHPGGEGGHSAGGHSAGGHSAGGHSAGGGGQNAGGHMGGGGQGGS